MTPSRRPREIWNDTSRLDRWHRIWIGALKSQIELNPDLPVDSTTLDHYRSAADEFRDDQFVNEQWWNDYDKYLKACRHEVVAALDTLNSKAQETFAHMGMTSCDVTESANQQAIRESFSYVHKRVNIIERLIADRVVTERGTRMVARTHGQPAQLTTLGYRYATLLEPLLEWTRRFAWYISGGYVSRPQAGAVGTWADQARVLTGWQQPEKASTMASEATGSASEVSLNISTPEGLQAATEWLLTMGDQMAARLKTAKNPNVVALAANYERIRAQDPLGNVAGNVEDLTRRVSSWETSSPGEQRPGVSGSSGQDQPRDQFSQETPRKDEYLDTACPDVGDFVSREERPDVSELIDRFKTRNAMITGYGRTAESSRQVYHRSQDLHWVAMLAELASIAQTWATDRRLESMLGLGAESFGDEQVGSSAMPHKQNPRFSERVCALAAVTRSHLTAFAELAGQEWLEGDVSTSAARRKLLADTFENIDALLQNWAWVITHWEPNVAAIDSEVHRSLNQMSTGALLQAAVEADSGSGVARLTRDDAYDRLRGAFQQLAKWSPAKGLERSQLAYVLADFETWPLTQEQTQRVMDEVATGQIGDIDAIMREVVTEAQDRHQSEIDLEELGKWMAELR